MSRFRIVIEGSGDVGDGQQNGAVTTMVGAFLRALRDAGHTVADAHVDALIATVDLSGGETSSPSLEFIQPEVAVALHDVNLASDRVAQCAVELDERVHMLREAVRAHTLRPAAPPAAEETASDVAPPEVPPVAGEAEPPVSGSAPASEAEGETPLAAPPSTPNTTIVTDDSPTDGGPAIDWDSTTPAPGEDVTSDAPPVDPPPAS